MEIIFIDDQEDVREIMGLVLSDSLGVKVNCFESAVNVKSYIQENKKNISLIICDHKLPKLTGLDFYDEIKDTKIPFILMTGMFFSDDDPQVAKFIKGQSNKLIYKPIDKDSLISEINNLREAA